MPKISRIKFLRNFTFVALAIIIVRLFFIQIIEHNEWVAKANDQHTLLETITAKRGEIYMMDDGNPVAVVQNQTTYSVIIDPAVTDKEALKTMVPESSYNELISYEGKLGDPNKLSKLLFYIFFQEFFYFFHYQNYYY